MIIATIKRPPGPRLSVGAPRSGSLRAPRSAALRRGRPDFAASPPCHLLANVVGACGTCAVGGGLWVQLLTTASGRRKRAKGVADTLDRPEGGGLGVPLRAGGKAWDWNGLEGVGGGMGAQMERGEGALWCNGHGRLRPCPPLHRFCPGTVGRLLCAHSGHGQRSPRPGMCLKGGVKGGGSWDPKNCVPKRARPDFPSCRFRFFPRWSLWWGGGGAPEGEGG